MAYESVKNQIDAYIKANGVNLITGPVLNAVLTTMLDELGEGYAFQGVLNTTDTPSPAADIPQAWLASAGTYLGGSITVDEGELALITHTAEGWSKETVYRGLQLSHDAIVDALGYTPADETDLAEKQDTIADLPAIRSGAALGSTSVQPVDIENMVEAEPIGSIVPPVNPSEFATKEELSQLSQKVTDISTEPPEDDEEMVQVVSDDGETIYLEISEDGVDAKDLKSNGEQVLTATTGATKAELNEKQDTIQEIQSEETISQENEQIWCSDDYDGNGNGELYAKVNSDGMFAKNIKRLDGASALFSPLFGKKIRIFGGSVAFLLDKYTGGDIIRSTGATLTDDAQSGAGFANNLSLVDGAIVYGGANIQKQVDDATATGQVKADIYILWASTNDYATASIQVGDNEDYTIADNFDVSARLTQCGGINYCIKKLCEFAPEAKVVVFGSLKCFENPGGGWTSGGCGLDGRLKALVDGQHECAMRSSLPFFSLWENSGFNEYNSNTYFYHGDDDMYYPAGHGNDGTHPNKEGYIYLANKIINFLNAI